MICGDGSCPFGAGVDGSIHAHDTSFTALGLPYQQSAYSNSSVTLMSKPAGFLPLSLYAAGCVGFMSEMTPLV